MGGFPVLVSNRDQAIATLPGLQAQALPDLRRGGRGQLLKVGNGRDALQQTAVARQGGAFVVEPDIVLKADADAVTCGQGQSVAAQLITAQPGKGTHDIARQRTGNGGDMGETWLGTKQIAQQNIGVDSGRH